MEFEESVNVMENVNVEESVGISEKAKRFRGKKEKRFRGVSKRKGKWRARVRHPKLRTDIHLGYFRSAEEAAAVVQKKKAEYDEMFKRKDSASVGMSDVEFEGGKLPYGVRRSGDSSLGSDCSPEEEVVTVEKNKVKLGKMYGCNCVDAIVEEHKCGFECGAAKVPAGVNKNRSGKWIARTRDPESKKQIWLGTFNTSEDAIEALNKKKAVFAARGNRLMFDEKSKCGMSCCDSEATENPVEPDCEIAHGCMTSGSSNDTNYMATDDASARDKLQTSSVYGFSSTVLEPSVSSDVDVSDISVTREDYQKRIVCPSSFDEAVSLGFIDEYGQLLGQHSILDEYTCLNLPEDDIASA